MSDDTAALTASDRFARAVSLHQAGRDAEAIVDCEAALAERTEDARLWQLAGIVYSRLGRNAEALAALARAVNLEPRDTDLRLQQASVHLRQGNRADAIASLTAMLAIDPTHLEALRTLAALRRENGDLDGAIAALEQLLRQHPNDTRAWSLLGACRSARFEFGHAEACYRRAAVIDPESVAAHVAHAGALRNVADPEAALAAADRAVALAPDNQDAHVARAGALRELRRTVEGLAATEQVLARDPGHVGALMQAGLLLHDAGNPEAAVAAYRKALAGDPDHVDAHWNCGVALLALGRFEEGFAEYEWRYRSPLFYRGKPRHAQPRWDGSPLDGRMLLVHGEQGLGDTIQYLRFVPAVAARGDMVLEVQAPLRALVAGAALAPTVCGIGDPLPPFDLRTSLLSLPHLLGLFPGDAELSMPYLAADTARIARWAKRLDRLPWPRVGLCWRGNAANPRDLSRSIALSTLRPLFEEPVSFVSLQQADAAPEIVAAELRDSIEDWSTELDRDGAFLDTAALMMSLDLVVTVDTSIAHLAGALARPTLLLLSTNPDHRWMLGRDDTPWYPSLRLLRQHRAGDWSGPIEAVRQSLWRLVADG
jgi:tetratricopeptide (TPR) repeat protein